MQRKRNSLIPLADALADLPGPVQALQPLPPTQHHFTQTDQVNQLAAASEADPYMGFMARMHQTRRRKQWPTRELSSVSISTTT